MNDPDDTQNLDRYLLGRLTADESDALEARMLRDERFFELAEAAEDDLVDRYARGELSPDDAKRFERHLLSAPRIRERVGVARALATVAERRDRPIRSDRGERGVVAPVSRKPVRLAWAAALIAAIAAGAVGFEVFRLHDETGFEGPVETAQVRESEPERSVVVTPAEEPAGKPGSSALEPAATDKTPPRETNDGIVAREPEPAEEGATFEAIVPPASVATVFLAATTRGVASEPHVLEMGDAELAEIQVDLGRKRPSGKVEARVLRGSDVVWEERSVEVLTEERESMARLLVPGKRLTEGRYRVELVERSGKGHEAEALGTYEFSVEP